MRILILFLIAALTWPLAGCVTNGTSGHSVKLPEAPGYYAACFTKLTNIPATNLTRDRVIKLVAELRRSELRHSQCGKDLLAWYATVRTAYGK